MVTCQSYTIIKRFHKIYVFLNHLIQFDTLSFIKGDTGIRYAMSGDVIVDEESFLQFEVAMGCVSNRECYSKFFKYFSTFTKNLH